MSAGSGPTLTTERLLLRPWRPEDREPFAALNADPEVAEFLPRPITREQSDELVDRTEAQFVEHGYGLWAVEVPGEIPFAGFVGLSLPTFEASFMPCVEVGWRLARESWGRGFATEAARAALRFGFTEVGLDEILSFTVPANLRSRRVMERLGMQRDPALRLPASPPCRRGPPARPRGLPAPAIALEAGSGMSAFEILRDEPERLEGIATGIDRSHLKRLRKGEVEVDEDVDLHGLEQREARVAVREAIARAREAGGRCVRVVHGRGLHSAGGAAVLRERLPHWLAEPPCGALVMAFASGLRERGGATYVLLRRKRS